MRDVGVILGLQIVRFGFCLGRRVQEGGEGVFMAEGAGRREREKTKVKFEIGRIG